MLTYQQFTQKFLVHSMPFERLFWLLRHQIQVAGNVLQVASVQRPEMLFQFLTCIDIADVRQGKQLESGKLGKGSTL